MNKLPLWEQLIYYFQHNGSYVLNEFCSHFFMAVYGVFFAALLAIPLGILIAKHGKLAPLVINLANIIQTIPSLALLSILMLGFGLGSTTVIITVFFYSLLPIISNTYTGVKQVDRSLLDVGKGMGMTPWQRLRLIEIPLSISIIMAGLRNALVIAVGIVAIGSFVGAGGLGDIITRGTNATNGTAIILAGALPTAFMAIGVDLILGIIERYLDPETKLKQ